LKLEQPLLAQISTPISSEAKIHGREVRSSGSQQAEPRLHAGLCHFAAEPRQYLGFRGNSREERADFGGGAS